MIPELIQEIGDDMDRLRAVREELMKAVREIEEQIVLVAKRMSLN